MIHINVIQVHLFDTQQMCMAIPVIKNADKKASSPEDLPGDLAIWMFIYAELMVFGVFFVTYIVTRSNNVELFNQYQLTLDARLGLINTLVLLTSSFFVVKSVNATKRDDKDRAVFWLFASVLTGIIFVVIKSYEFYSKYSEGINLSTNTFYTFYLSMTFFHYMHVILGLVILSAMLLKANRGGYCSTDMHGLETGASYWHMVDLVWVVLFPLVYLIR